MNELMEFAKTVPYFPPNSCAWGHAALGFGVGTYMDNPWAQAAAAIAFVMYEICREKPMNEKLGAVAEFATGYLAGKVFMGVTAK
jgi:hypothetical protein